MGKLRHSLFDHNCFMIVNANCIIQCDLYTVCSFLNILAEEEFDKLCFDFGIELDEVVIESL
jgi:hypothetical protein